MLTKKVTYVYEHHAYNRNNAGYVNVGNTINLVSL